MPRPMPEPELVTPASFANALTSPFAKLWRGQYSLPVAFWKFFILGIFLAQFIAGLIGILFYFVGMPQVTQPLFNIATVVYPIFAAVGVWRSANARPFQRWPLAAAAAKFGVCVCLLMIAIRVARIGIPDMARLTG